MVGRWLNLAWLRLTRWVRGQADHFAARVDWNGRVRWVSLVYRREWTQKFYPGCDGRVMSWRTDKDGNRIDLTYGNPEYWHDDPRNIIPPLGQPRTWKRAPAKDEFHAEVTLGNASR